MSTANKNLSKLPFSIDNPIDVLMSKMCFKIAPLFKLLRFTPNGITALSFVTGLLAIYHFYECRPILSCVLLFISFMFDYLDGIYARKYNMVTKFGSYFDHFKDLFVFVLYLVIIYLSKLTNKTKLILIIISFISLIIYTIHVACQEKYSKYGYDYSLGFLGKHCPSDNNKDNIVQTLKYTRYWGCANVLLTQCVIIFYVCYYSSRV
jgi:phosphatidylglycerophosphate synthase